MAVPAHTIRQWYTTNTNPRPRGGLLTTYRPEANAGTPQELLQRSVSDTYPLVFLGSEIDGRPKVFVNPDLPQVMLPGAPPSTIYLAYVGDLTERGGEPTVCSITSDDLRLTGAVTVPSDDRMTALLAAQPNAISLPNADVAAGDTVQANSRVIMAIPHQYAADILDANANGTLTTNWLWSVLLAPARAAGGQDAHDVRILLDHVKIMGTRRPPLPNNPNFDLPPRTARTTDIPHVADATRDNMKTRIVNNFLLGLRPNVGISANLAQVQANQHAMQQQQLAAQQAAVARANREKTLEDDKPAKFIFVSVLNCTKDETKFGNFWKTSASTKDNEMLGPLNTAMETVAHHSDWQAPLVDASVAINIVQGAIQPRVFGSILSPLSIVRIFHHYCPNLEQIRLNNTIYSTSQTGTGAASTEAVNIVVADNNMVLPLYALMFEPGLQAWQCLLEAVMPNNPVVLAIQQQLVAHAQRILTKLTTLYRDPRQQAVAMILVYTHAVRKFHQYIKALFTAHRNYLNDLALNPPAPGAPAPSWETAAAAVPVPAFDIEDRIDDNLLFLAVSLPTEVGLFLDAHERSVPMPYAPPGMFSYIQPQLPPPVAPPALYFPGQPPAPAQQPAPAPAPTPTPAPAPGQDSSNAPDHQGLNYNLDLKRGYAAYRAANPNVTGIFSPTSPFYDGAARGNRRIIPSDTPNVRICLSSALVGRCFRSCKGKHGPLSQGEVNRVIQVGGFELA